MNMLLRYTNSHGRLIVLLKPSITINKLSCGLLIETTIVCTKILCLEEVGIFLTHIVEKLTIEKLKEQIGELTLLDEHLKPPIPLLILSSRRLESDPYISSYDVSEALELNSLSRPWMVCCYCYVMYRLSLCFNVTFV